MKVLYKTFLFFAVIVYSAHFVNSLFSDEADKWIRWITFEFHVGVLCACLFVGASKWAYERINNNK